MTAAESSVVGLAIQAVKGTPIVADASFHYFLFQEGGIGPQNINLPLDQEVGGGAMLRSVIKAGVSSAGAFTLIPRPCVLGYFLLGALDAPTTTGAGPNYNHVFKMGADQFAAKYFTIRSSPGNMWGEQFQDARVAALGINWKAADFIRGSVAFIGGLPTPNVSMTTWAPTTYLDKGPQFIAAKSLVEVPDATALKVLSGSLAMGMNIPMDEQWITGSYTPDDFQINSRIFTLSLGIKVTDATLYNKMAYDPAAGAAWAAALYKEANIDLQFISDQMVTGVIPYSLAIKANGCTAAAGTANVAWTCTPIAMRAGKQVVMTMTGTFLASPDADPPITATLVNNTSAYA